MSNMTEEYALERLRRRNEKLSSLLEVATALSREHDLEAILDLILAESVKTVDAERGSLFIVDRARTELLSKIALGERATIRLPLGLGIAGTVARTGVALNVPDAYADARFNPEVDKLTGFRTRSILCVPMIGSKHEVVGVVQALNHRQGPFSEEDEEFLRALAASAAAAIENANLYEEIERLFEGFVQASITAIESRDPSTAGHSSRVAELSVTLMQSLEHSSGPYRSVTFSSAEVREVRYAALLHDFGKVGVREHVLLKADKLFPHELERLELRFEAAKRSLEIDCLRRELELYRRTPDRAAEEALAITEQFHRGRLELDELLEFVRRCNRPAVLETDGFARLQEVARKTFTDSSGCAHSLLSEHELSNLAIARGSLNPEERREIESHVTHTFNFLKAIPWTRALARVPEIAHGHHEKLNGQGYPRALGAHDIPVQTRIMTIADIYDALTAADRPYKKAIPRTKALEILEAEARANNIDDALLNVFIEARVPERALGVSSS